MNERIRAVESAAREQARGKFLCQFAAFVFVTPFAAEETEHRLPAGYGNHAENQADARANGSRSRTTRSLRGGPLRFTHLCAAGACAMRRGCGRMKSAMASCL